MLGKLFKYEWKSTCRVCLLLLAAIGGTTLLGALIFQAPMWKDILGGSGSAGETLVNVVSVLAILLYILLLVGAFYAAFLYLMVHFYRSTYKSEGYLLHTLPVQGHQIVFSKVAMGSIWVYLIYIAMIISVTVFFLAMISAFSGESVFWLLGHMRDFWAEVSKELRTMFGGLSFNGASWMALFCFSLILGVPSSLLILFGAISLGQLFAKNRVLMAVVCYVGIMIARWILTSLSRGVCYAVASLGRNGDIFGYLNSSLLISIVIDVFLAVGCYAVSCHVISRRLNLE